MNKVSSGTWISIGIGVVTVGFIVWSWTNRKQTSGSTYTDPWPGIVAAHKASLPQGYHQDIRALRRLLELRWAYLDMRRAEGKVDLDTMERKALVELGDEPDRNTFERVLRHFVAGLWDGHAAIELPQKHASPDQRMLPLILVDVAEGIAVHATTKELAENVDLKPCDLVLAIDGVPIEEVLLQAGRSVFASSKGSRRRQALWNTWWRTSRKQVELDVKRGTSTSKLRVPTVPIGTPIPAHSLLLFQPKSEMLANQVAYLRPGTFSAPPGSGWRAATPEQREEILRESYAKLIATVKGFEKARALILDLRGNGGGTDLLGQALAGLLLEEQPTYYQLQGQGKDGKWGIWHDNPVRKLPGGVPFLGPLVCLIDSRTFSTADNLAACLHDVHPRIRFVGRPTGAGTGAPRSFPLPNSGVSVRFCTMRVRAPKSGMIEGKGVQPDHPVQWTCEDHIHRRDPDLAQALQLIEEWR